MLIASGSFLVACCVRDWSGILLKRSGKRYSGKPDGGAGTPKKETQNLKTSESQKFFRISGVKD
jgi:hypothetical protein